MLLWLPWFPVFLRQAVNPPVPPWRAPWSTAQAFLASLAETLGALVIGQTPPGGRMWPFALVAVLALGLFLWLGSEGQDEREETGAHSTLLIYIFVPLGLLYLFTATVTPLYHVRYVFLYAPPFMLILAAAILALLQQKTWLAWGALALILGISTWGLYEFWSNPRYRADDHRTAVADLARNWRPDDLILANAGWIYPTLEIYWPTELVGPLASRPPAIVWDGRFNNYADQVRDGLPESETPAPVIIARTGSVDGDLGLGWSHTASDFFAVTEAETLASLDTLGAAHPRLWHYRLYDTVSDPTGVIRAWLDQNGVLVQDLPYAGRDFLRVQRYDMAVNPPLEEEVIPVDARFGDALQLVGSDPHTLVEAGEILYVNLHLEGLTGMDDLGTDLSFSLRLYEAGSDLLLVQQDVAPQPPTSSWQPGTRVQQSFALPVPISAKPLRYTIELVVYRQDTGEPLVPDGDPARVIAGQRWRIGMTDIFKSPYPSEISERLASFDYIDLAHAALDRAESRAGDEFRAELVWYPNPSDYRDAYDVIIELREADGTVAAAWQQVAGGLNYPSSVWPAGYPLREVRVMPLADDLAAGDYTVALRMARRQRWSGAESGNGAGTQHGRGDDRHVARHRTVARRPPFLPSNGRKQAVAPLPRYDTASPSNIPGTARNLATREARQASICVDHLDRHAAVDNKVLPCNKSGLFRKQERGHRSNVPGGADAPCRVLRVVQRTQVRLAPPTRLLPRPHVDPTWADAVDADGRPQTDGQRMGERDQAALRRAGRLRCWPRIGGRGWRQC